MPEGYIWAKSPLFDVFAVFSSELGEVTILDFRHNPGGEVHIMIRRETRGQTPLLAVNSALVKLIFLDGNKVTREWTIDLVDRREEIEDVPSVALGGVPTEAFLHPFPTGRGSYWGKFLGPRLGESQTTCLKPLGFFGRMDEEEIEAIRVRSLMPLHGPEEDLTIIETGKGWMLVPSPKEDIPTWAKISGRWVCWCLDKPPNQRWVFIGVRHAETWPEPYEWLRTKYTLRLEEDETLVDFGTIGDNPHLATKAASGFQLRTPGQQATCTKLVDWYGFHRLPGSGFAAKMPQHIPVLDAGHIQAACHPREIIFLQRNSFGHPVAARVSVSGAVLWQTGWL